MKNRIIMIVMLFVGLLLVSGLAAQDNAPPFLGITFDSVDNGAVVTSVVPESAAAIAGLEDGDIITAVNGEEISADDLAAAIGDLAAGDNVMLGVMRGDESLTLDAQLQARPEFDVRRFQTLPFENMERPYLGVSLEVTDAGVAIAQVEPNSPAAEADLQVGDVISAINGESIADAAGAAALIGDLEPGTAITLDIMRGEEAMSIEATLGSRIQQNFEMTVMGDIVVFDGEDWRILAVGEDSPLAAAGLQSGDVVTAINGEMSDPEALADVIANGDAEVALTVERGDETLDITVVAADLESFNGLRFFGRNGEFYPLPGW